MKDGWERIFHIVFNIEPGAAEGTHLFGTCLVPSAAPPHTPEVGTFCVVEVDSEEAVLSGVVEDVAKHSSV